MNGKRDGRCECLRVPESVHELVPTVLYLELHDWFVLGRGADAHDSDADACEDIANEGQEFRVTVTDDCIGNPGSGEVRIPGG